MTGATTTLTLTAAELSDLRSAVRAQVRVLAAEADDGRAFGFRATRPALLSPRLTDALDALEAEPV